MGVAIGHTTVVFAVSFAMIFQLVPVTLAGLGAGEVVGTMVYMSLGLAWEDALLLVSALYSFRLIAAGLSGLWEASQGLSYGARPN